MDATEASWLGLVEHARTLEPDPALRHLTDDDLTREVRDLASQIAAATCQWLLHVGELVVRGLWADDGARTPGQWLSWAVGLDTKTAREKVRVALALRNLPKIRARFAAGTISYSKVRTITRVAVPEIEDDLLNAADSCPASVLNRILAQAKRSRDEVLRWQDGPPTEPPGDVRDLRRVVVDPDTVELRIRLSTADAAAVEERLDRLVDVADRASRGLDDGEQDARPTLVAVDDDASADALPPRPSRAARRVEALCDALAVAVAAGPADRSGLDDHLVVLHVQAEELVAAVSPASASSATETRGPGAPELTEASADALAPPDDASAARRTRVTTGRGRGMRLPRSVLAWLACDAELRVAGIDGHGHPADIGRRSRKVPADLRRALQLRDRHCRFPGCHATRGLHAHHVLHWALGGPTDLGNLTLLCGYHHRFVHESGWDLRPVPGRPGRWSFHAPDAVDPMPPVLPLPGASADAVALMQASEPPPLALQPPYHDGMPYDLDHVVASYAEMLLDVAA